MSTGLQETAPRRHDVETLEEELQWARRGTAYFARKLNELSDKDFQGASLLPGWNRAQLIAHVGYNARAVARLVEWAATGVETPMYRSPEQRADEIALGATLHALALRNLFHHSAVHLNVEWRDLAQAGWRAQVRTAQGRLVPATETPWMRAREVWVHAVDLANGAGFVDFPPAFVDALLADVVAGWHRKNQPLDIVLAPVDRDHRLSAGSGGVVVSGSAADLARWVTGRGARRVRAAVAGDALPLLPPWL